MALHIDVKGHPKVSQKGVFEAILENILSENSSASMEVTTIGYHEFVVTGRGIAQGASLLLT
eukprot:1564163-Pleurochrysis_carterae.AAC.1